MRLLKNIDKNNSLRVAYKKIEYQEFQAFEITFVSKNIEKQTIRRGCGS